MLHNMVLTGYFLVQDVDKGHGKYNVLLVQEYSELPNMVAAWTKSEEELKKGSVVHLQIEAKCSRAYEVLEGDGKRGSGWRKRDDWYVNSRPYICNAVSFERIEDVR